MKESEFNVKFCASRVMISLINKNEGSVYCDMRSFVENNNKTPCFKTHTHTQNPKDLMNAINIFSKCYREEKTSLSMERKSIGHST